MNIDSVDRLRVRERISWRILTKVRCSKHTFRDGGVPILSETARLSMIEIKSDANKRDKDGGGGESDENGFPGSHCGDLVIVEINNNIKIE